MPESAPTEPTARQKRDMTNLGRVEGFLKVPGTPYVVLSVDGPVDTRRLMLALAPDPEPAGPQPFAYALSQANAADSLDSEAAAALLMEAGATDPQQLFADPGGADELEEPEPAPDPETVILTHLREHGPGSPRDIADATGLPKLTTTVELVRLVNQGAVSKNGLAYALNVAL